MPVENGSVTFNPAATPTAASAALPPFFSIVSPISAAKGLEQATHPWQDKTGERLEEKVIFIYNDADTKSMDDDARPQTTILLDQVPRL